MQAGALLGDGLGDGVLIEPDTAAGAEFDLSYLRETSFALLQGSRMRNTKTEFVSCPSCGRTLFDLQVVLPLPHSTPCRCLFPPSPWRCVRPPSLSTLATCRR